MKKIIGLLLLMAVISFYNTVSFAKPSNEVINAAQGCLKTFSEHIHPSDPRISGDIKNLRLGTGYESYQLKYDDIKANKINESSTFDSFAEFNGDYIFTVYSGDTEMGIMHLIYKNSKMEIISMFQSNGFDKHIEDILDQSGLILSDSEKLDYKVISSESGFLALAVKSGGKDCILTDGTKSGIIGKKNATLLEMQVAISNTFRNVGIVPAGGYGDNEDTINFTLYAVIIGSVLLGIIAIIIIYRKMKLKHIVN